MKQNSANTSFTPGAINNTTGILTGVAGLITSPGQTISTSGTFATITFTAGTTKGNSGSTLTDVIVGDINGQSVIVSLVNGQASVDHAPILAAIGSKTVNENTVLSFTTSAADTDGNTLTYSASNLPSGAVFNPYTQLFTWTPTHSQIGTYPNVHFHVADGILTAPENITITVAAVYAAWDINMDGTVNVLDLTLVTQHFAETGTPNWIRQDINGDGVINVLDCILIGQHWSV